MTSTTPDEMGDAERVKDALMAMCPDPMRAMFAPMVEMAVAQIPADSLSELASDLQSAMGENGEPDIGVLQTIGKRFGLTDAMIAGYTQSAEALQL